MTEKLVLYRVETLGAHKRRREPNRKISARYLLSLLKVATFRAPMLRL